MVRVNTWLLKGNDFEKQMAVLFTWTWVKDRRESGVDDGYLTQSSVKCRLVAFYVSEHNHVLPHSAFRGQTPDEMYFGTGDAVLAALR